MKTIHIFCTIILGLAFFSCEKSLVYIEEQFDPRVVSNSVLFADSTFSVDISMSKSALDEEPVFAVPAADIQLYENGKQVVNLSHPQQNLQSDFRFTEGNTYRLEVQAKNQKLTAETTIPVHVPILGVDTVYVKRKQQPGTWQSPYNADKDLKLAIKINDPGNEKNYYRLVMLQKYYRLIYGKDEVQYELTYTPVWYSMDDIVFGEKSTTDNPFDVDHIANSYAIFDDQLFNGKEKTIDLSVIYLGSSTGYDYNTKPTDLFEGQNAPLRFVDLIICIQSLSKEAWLYYKSRDAYNSTYGDEFVEPVPVYTNMNNGLGIFMGISQAVNTINVDRKNFYIQE